MGILNRTPDSFFDRGEYWDLDDFYRRAEQLVREGADLLDVGGVKAGPGPEVGEAEELDRVVPAIAALHDRFDVALSVDTWRATVAAEAFRAGAVMGNDISGFADPAYLPAGRRRLGPRWWPPTFASGPGSRTRTRTMTTSSKRWGATSPIGPARPGGPVSQTAGSSWTLGSTWARRPAQSATLLRASDRLAGPGLAVAALRFQQELPGRPFRSRRCRPGRSHGGGTRTRRQPRVPDRAGPRRPGGPSGLRHPGRGDGGGLMPGRTAAPAGTLPVLLVDGDDSTLIAEAVRAQLAELIGDEERDLAVEDFGGDEVDLARVADSCATPPFLSDRRIVVVRDVGRFSTDEVAPLLAYLEDPLPTTVLILVAGGGTVAPKLAAAVKAHGHVQSTKVAPRDARDWVRGRIRAAPLRVEPAAETLIETHLGEDVSRLGALLEVLVAAYGEGSRVGPEEVEPYLGEAGSVAPWTLHRRHRRRPHRGRSGAAAPAPRTEVTATRSWCWPSCTATCSDSCVWTTRRSRPRLKPPPPWVSLRGRSTFPAKKALAASRRWGSSGSRRGHWSGGRCRAGAQGRQRLAGGGHPRGARGSAVPPGPGRQRRWGWARRWRRSGWALSTKGRARR